MRFFGIFALSVSAFACAVSAHAQAGLSLPVMALAKKCAPDIAPITMGYLVAHESRNNPYAFNVNGGHQLPWMPTNREEAVALIRWLEEKGYNYDVGLGQVNSGNFKRLNVTAESLLDGCDNLRASSAILTGCYQQAVKEVGEGQRALLQAFSCYNTGSQTNGFANGYVQKILAQVQPMKIPALQDESEPELKSHEDKDSGNEGTTRKPRQLGTPDAFENSAKDAFSDSDPGAFAEQEGPEQSDR